MKRDSSKRKLKPASNEQLFLDAWSAVELKFYRADFGGVDWAQAGCATRERRNAERQRIDRDCLWYLAVKGIAVDGESLKGHGVEPTHVVPDELTYTLDCDPQLERALEVLSREVKR